MVRDYEIEYSENGIQLTKEDVMKRNRTPRVATAYHRSTLKDCLETEQPITIHLARMFLKLNIYKFYAYDERIKANRYLIYKIEGNVGMPTWLHIYVD